MAKLEILPPAPNVNGIKEYKKQLKYVLMLKKRHLEKKVPGNIRINRKKNGSQFYLVTDKNNTNGKYLSVKQKSLVKEIFQWDYDKKVVRKLEKLVFGIEKFLKCWEQNDLPDVFEKLLPPRKLLVVPDTLPDEQYAAQWLKKKYCGKDFYATQAEYFTTEGLRVRSKSEIIIAETLAKQGVPFRYEYPVEINGRTFHPDFYCLDLSTRREIIWEHFGMMGDPDYAENAAGKLEAYIKNGWLPGKNLIVTMETAGVPLNQNTVRKLTAAYFA